MVILAQKRTLSALKRLKAGTYTKQVWHQKLCPSTPIQTRWSPPATDISCFRRKPRPGLLRGLYIFKLLYLPQDLESHFENFLVQKCRGELLPWRIPVSATMQLPEVKLKVTAQQHGEAEQTGCRRWPQPLLYQLGKGKSWNIPGSCCSGLMHTSREAARTAGRNPYKTAGMGQKPPPQGKSSSKGEFQSHFIGNDLLKVGNFHLNDVLIFSFFPPLPPRGGFPGIQWSEAPWMCQAHLLWWSLADEPAHCSWWAQGAWDKPQWLQKKYTHAYFCQTILKKNVKNK